MRRGVLRVIQGGQLGFWCPGCKTHHAVHEGWAFNGNYESPTFTPSILVTSGHYVSDWAERRSKDPRVSCWCIYNAEHPNQPAPYICQRCHSFVTDGSIRYLDDCTHDLKGQTVRLTAPAWWGD